MRALATKAVRDLFRHWGQLLAIALVLACGLALYVCMRTTMAALLTSQHAWYAEARFAHVSAALVRSPEHVADRLRAIPGVQRVQTRVVLDATLDLDRVVEAVVARLVSLPDRGRPQVNDLRLRSGRWPVSPRPEVLVHEGFALAHRLHPGDELVAILDGRRQRLRVVGTALSPEFTFAVGPGQLFPDDRRFGVLWMPRAALAPAADMDGAFDDVALQLAPGADPEPVCAAVDLVLARYGGLGAIPRRDQPSHFFLSNELRQLATLGVMVPTLFLIAAVLLLQIVVGRLVLTQRGQIAVLKAVGYRDREVGAHYVGLVAMVAAAAWAFGLLGGSWLGGALTEEYARYYRFPELPWQLSPAEALRAAGVCLLAVGAGVAGAVLRTVRLPPAEAMRPPAPAAYRRTLLERLGVMRRLSPGARMVLRELARRPLRAAMSVVGVAMATAMVVVGLFTYDSLELLVQAHLGLERRADVQLQLTHARDPGVCSSLRALPGVHRVEGVRSAAVRLRAGPRARLTGLVGVPADAELQAVLDSDLRPIRMPDDGVVLPRVLAEALGVAAGERVELEVLEGARPRLQPVVARVAETFVGSQAYVRLGALNRALGEPPGTANSALLEVRHDRVRDLHAAVKATPLVAGIDVRDEAIRSLRNLLDESMGSSMAITLGLALTMALGVLYNTGRIVVEERTRDLVTLRVLGFRRREVAGVLVGEITALLAMGVPTGLGLGVLMAWAMCSSEGFNNEQFRLPLVITSATLTWAALTVLGAGAVATFLGWRRLDRTHLVHALDARD